MNWNQIEAQWKDFAGSARAHWSKLTEEDWQNISGKRDELVGRVQQRYGITRPEAERQVEQWSSALQNIAEASKTH